MIARDLMIEADTVKPKEDLVSVGTRMYDEKISGAIVVDDDRVVGILSKGGIVTCVRMACENHGTHLTVGDVMDKNFEVVSPDGELKEILRKFSSMPYRINRLPVLVDGKLVGEILKNRIVEVYKDSMKGKFTVGQLMEYKPSYVYDYTNLGDVIDEVYASSDKKVLVKKGDSVIGIITILDIAVKVFKGYKSGGCADLLTDVLAEEIMTAEPTTITVDEDAQKAAEIMIAKKIGGIPVDSSDIEGIITKNDLIKGLRMSEEKIST